MAVVRTTTTPYATATAQPTPSVTAVRARPVAVVPPRPGLIVDRIHGLGAATQAIVVTADGWRANVATLEAFSKNGGTWRVATASTSAFIGLNGFSSNKREGDRTTPAGIYSFGTMFGTAPSPGVLFAYRQSTPSDVWVDDPHSSLYNTWQRDPPNGRWSSAERLYDTRRYRYAAAIAYNTARTPGKGSAMFLHVSVGNATLGCVAVDQSVLVWLLRWLDPARKPVIVMGPRSYVETI